MKQRNLVLGVAFAVLTAAAGAQTTTQTTIVRAPITAVAFAGRTAEVNVNTKSGNHTVVVRKPQLALAIFHSMRININ